MADIFSKEKRSEVMSRIRPKGTRPEQLVFKYLRQQKIYFQKHYKRAVGSPDVALPRKKRAVFIDGDFWHGWKFEQWKHKLPNEYWLPKIEANIRRDRRNFAKLRREGWKLLRVWEHDLVPRKRDATLKRIADFLTAG
jgi:DNA mismatch endonuclease, patch repair protein